MNTVPTPPVALVTSAPSLTSSKFVPMYQIGLSEVKKNEGLTPNHKCQMPNPTNPGSNGVMARAIFSAKVAIISRAPGPSALFFECGNFFCSLKVFVIWLGPD